VAPGADGNSIIVCGYDTEKCEPIGTADIFAAYDTVGIEKRVHEILNLTRRNFPTPEELYEWIKEWDSRRIDFCEICEGEFAGYDCKVCPIEAVKYEQEGEE